MLIKYRCSKGCPMTTKPVIDNGNQNAQPEYCAKVRVTFTLQDNDPVFNKNLKKDYMVLNSKGISTCSANSRPASLISSSSS